MRNAKLVQPNPNASAAETTGEHSDNNNQLVEHNIVLVDSSRGTIENMAEDRQGRLDHSSDGQYVSRKRKEPESSLLAGSSRSAQQANRSGKCPAFSEVNASGKLMLGRQTASTSTAETIIIDDDDSDNNHMLVEHNALPVDSSAGTVVNVVENHEGRLDNSSDGQRRLSCKQKEPEACNDPQFLAESSTSNQQANHSDNYVESASFIAPGSSSSFPALNHSLHAFPDEGQPDLHPGLGNDAVEVSAELQTPHVTGRNQGFSYLRSEVQQDSASATVSLPGIVSGTSQVHSSSLVSLTSSPSSSSTSLGPASNNTTQVLPILDVSSTSESQYIQVHQVWNVSNTTQNQHPAFHPFVNSNGDDSLLSPNSSENADDELHEEEYFPRQFPENFFTRTLTEFRRGLDAQRHLSNASTSSGRRRRSRSYEEILREAANTALLTESEGQASDRPSYADRRLGSSNLRNFLRVNLRSRALHPVPFYVQHEEQEFVEQRIGETTTEDVTIIDRATFYGMRNQGRGRLDVENMSYEQLMSLEEEIGKVRTGLGEEFIKAHLKHREYHSVELGNVEDGFCCVCQEEFAGGDNLGTLDCGHEFHYNCIKQWLMEKNFCPVCKSIGLVK